MSTYYSSIRPDIGARVTVNGSTFGTVVEDDGSGPVVVQWTPVVRALENARLLQVVA